MTVADSCRASADAGYEGSWLLAYAALDSNQMTDVAWQEGVSAGGQPIDRSLDGGTWTSKTVHWANNDQSGFACTYDRISGAAVSWSHYRVAGLMMTV